ncbi:EutN/CcmL family microcompartment protein [Vibrio mangrovi]|uniref:Carbon dioxide concentrating mechanism protein CcmL n=1 Tax=Vibrio mangrovi TaxID=474394 RepID=A0A1Y6IY80_9VIBR|nr:EutN/CcmL family microcompartment protein [Vibrio mangrovi]MDW6005176.1 EutN/CcmL family microcompartment protein [Vibrio mangrovi]SMS02614.1 Carbon dioxide concentrating mechanism protein CcmL [Vibrio mangrovi]
MDLAKVVGSVVSTQKSDSLTGRKLLLVQAVDTDGTSPKIPGSVPEVAIDCVGAGDGEFVLVTRGSSARACLNNAVSAADLCVIAIVDSLSVHQ